MTISFNLERPILQDLRVRRAIALAIDQQPYLDNILFGDGAVAEAPISSGIPFAHHPDVDMPGYDVAEAGRLLDEAGWVREGDGTRTASGVEGVEDGTELSLNWLGFPNFARYGELMREQLRAVGIDLRVEPTEREAFIDRVFAEPGSRDWDTNVISYCNQSDPEIGVRRMYISSNIQAIPFSNAASYVNEDVDRLFDEAREEIDVEARSDLYRQISEIVVEELPYYWLVETTSTRVHRSNCTGFLPFGHFAAAASCDQ